MILIISNLYPSSKTPYYGSFVQNFVKDLEEYLPEEKIKICVLKGRCNNVLRKIILYIIFYIKILYNLLFFNYDYIYVHLITHSSLPIKLVSKFKKLNLIFNIHGEDLLVTTPLSKRLLNITKPLLINAKAVVVPSEYFKKITLKLIPELESNKIIVSASSGVRKSFFLDRKYKINSTLNIGYISRIDRGKGWDIFIKAIHILNNKGIDTKVTIIGGGAEVSKLKAMLKSFGLNNITYLGPIAYKDLPTQLKQIDLFVFPTLLNESLGLVGLEAMAASIPVIASNIGGITDYLTDNYNGYFFKPGDASDLANKIEKFIKLDSHQQETMSTNARTTANKYKADNVSKQLFDRIFKTL